MHESQLEASQLTLRLPSIPEYFLSERLGLHIVEEGVEIPGGLK